VPPQMFGGMAMWVPDWPVVGRVSWIIGPTIVSRQPAKRQPGGNRSAVRAGKYGAQLVSPTRRPAIPLTLVRGIAGARPADGTGIRLTECNQFAFGRINPDHIICPVRSRLVAR
jgi:hypothetical protein